MTESAPALHSVVELRTVSGRWPVGTVGTIIETYDDGALVEVADEQDRTLDLLSFPYDVLAPVRPPEQRRLSV